MKKSLLFVLVSIIFLLLNSCLTIEKKEYSIELNDNNSGTLTIKYINILSMKDDTTDVSENDFNELVANFIEGKELEGDYADASVRSKRLFEENGTLCGEVIIDFNNLRSIGLYQYNNNSPLMLNVGTFLESENYLKSNGEYGGDIMPVVFWPNSLKTLKLTTTVSVSDETTVSLLGEYKKWK